ncbi:MAG: hypothetical protein GY757_20910 [bacterium]|nr:hypothetical protein [bacterium]
MKILFIPYNGGVVPHGIPLIALKNKLHRSEFETAFLFPSKYHRMGKAIGLNVLDIDHAVGTNDFRTEMFAYGNFKPDIVVDDASPSTYFASRFEGIPRVAVRRTGMFTGGVPRNKDHKFTINFRIDDYKPYEQLGLPVPQTWEGLFEGDISLVPGIKSVEVFPQSLRNSPTHVFAGPLVVEDQILETVNASLRDTEMSGASQGFPEIEAFFELNKAGNRPVVYITFGNVAEPTPAVVESLQYLLDNGMAVITNIYLENVAKHQQELYYYASFLPMHLVCSRADFMIHHCGSGTYQYAILYRLPTITIGTGFYDREDVAMRLEELGVNRHLPGSAEADDFCRAFKEKVADSIDPSCTWNREAKRKLTRVKEESDQTVRSFDFKKMLLEAAKRYKAANL